MTRSLLYRVNTGYLSEIVSVPFDFKPLVVLHAWVLKFSSEWEKAKKNNGTACVQTFVVFLLLLMYVGCLLLNLNILPVVVYIHDFVEKQIKFVNTTMFC